MDHTDFSPELNSLSGVVIGLAIKVHSRLGPGLLESIYKECLFYEISRLGYLTEKEKVMPVFYETIKVDIGYRIDILVEEAILVEIKSIERLEPIHTARVLTYLKLSGCKLGLLINFNVPLLKDGIKRLIK